MNDTLHIPARPDAAIACNIGAAGDTAGQRLHRYALLFADALVDRQRQGGTVAFVFRDDPRVRAIVYDLAQREAACCPFFDYRVESIDRQLVWTITNPVEGDGRPAAEAILTIIHELPDHTTASSAMLRDRLAEVANHTKAP